MVRVSKHETFQDANGDQFVREITAYHVYCGLLNEDGKETPMELSEFDVDWMIRSRISMEDV